MAGLKLNHIYKVYENGTKAVSDFNMEIKDKEFIVFVGPSGCGKSTTLRMIAGLETPTSGEIIIDGVTVFDSKKGINISPAKRNVGFLFQNYALWPHMTVYKNIAFGLENLKWSKDQIKARVDELVKMLKIEDYLDRYPSQLSGGQQQRVSIGRAMMNEPALMLADEPTGNLDSKASEEIISLLRLSNKKYNQTVIVITHDEKIALEADRVITIDDGKIIKDERTGK